VTLTVQPLSPGPSSSLRPEELNALFRSRIGTFCHPQDTLLISRSCLGKSGFAISRNLCARSRATQNPEPRWVKESTLLFLSGISLSGNRTCDVGSLHHKSPNPELRWHVRYSLPRHLLSPLYRESRDHDFTSRNFFALKTPNAESRPLRDPVPPVPVDDQRLRLTSGNRQSRFQQV
jgi:hypothetical protein